MIDVSAITALIDAFRVETEKESISPETVGSLLQDIADLLATASTDAERQVLDTWKSLLSTFVVIYDIEQSAATNAKTVYLNIKGRHLRSGESFVFGSGCTIAPASGERAGAMTVEHVNALNTARDNIATIRAKLRTITDARSFVTGIQNYEASGSRVSFLPVGFDLATGRAIDLDPFHIPTASTTGAGVMTAAQCRLLGALRDAVLGGSTTSVTCLFSITASRCDTTRPSCHDAATTLTPVGTYNFAPL